MIKNFLFLKLISAQEEVRGSVKRRSSHCQERAVKHSPGQELTCCYNSYYHGGSSACITVF